MPIEIFVTATNTDVGKTHTTLLLMAKAAERGLRPAAFKPIETGVFDIPPDGAKLLEATRRLNPDAAHLRLEEIVPVRYALPAAPCVARGGAPVDYGLILERLEAVRSVCDILFVEGAGGLMVPVDEKRFMIDLPGLFGVTTTLLVTPGRLGCINDTLLSSTALQSRGIAFETAVNLREGEREGFDRITRPYYREAGVKFWLFPDEAESFVGALEDQRQASGAYR